MLDDGQVGNAGDAEPAFGKADLRFERVRHHTGLDFDLRGLAASGQGPLVELAGIGIAVDEAGVPGEVFRRLRRAHPAEIVGRADDRLAEMAERAGHQPGIGMLAGAEHHVEAFADDVDHPVGGIELELDLRVALLEGYELGHRDHAHRRQADA